VTINALLTTNNLTPLKISATSLTVPSSCTFSGTAGGRK
jgi:hypothetical protein